MKSVGPRPPCARHCNIQKIVTPHEDNTAAVNTTFRFPMSDLRPIKPHMVKLKIVASWHACIFCATICDD